MKDDATTTEQRSRHPRISLARRIAGWLVLVLGVIGLIFPVLPGIVLLALGLLILGPHDPLLRRIVRRMRTLLRGWSRAQHPWLRASGQRARRAVLRTRQMLRTHLHDVRRGRTSRAGQLAMLGVSLLGMVATATALVVLWRVLL
ncbi:hypothetical protein [Kallotenue papyrolyticum]|uniref:hypothetical protein n=1 Tax=Kallotenue papyrolyticum TaxID=1325125 RepID=UPI0004924286|nr:hypothetical protein [Kallotenue papyrolyticum]